MPLSRADIRAFHEDGYVVVRKLFDDATVQEMIAHYMALRAEGPKPGDFGGTADQPDDPNHRYPRMIHMHRWDARSSEWVQFPPMVEIAGLLMGDAPVLRQSMLYFKPPGGRGQGIHQDEQYITIDPLIGVWVALDRSDRDVGQMVVVPGSHRAGMLPVERADTSVSFTHVQSVLPDGAEITGVDMEPGDALFFHGRTIHGSYANTTRDRWRRSFICHFIGEHAQEFTPEQGTHVSHVEAGK